MSKPGKSIADDIVSVTRRHQSLDQAAQAGGTASVAPEAHRVERLLRSSRETVKERRLGGHGEGLSGRQHQRHTAGDRPTGDVRGATGDSGAHRSTAQTTSISLRHCLPDYIEEHGVDWDVVFDDRGHFREPHTDHGSGSVPSRVRRYEERNGEIDFEEPSFSAATSSPAAPTAATVPFYSSRKKASAAVRGSQSRRTVSTSP